MTSTRTRQRTVLVAVAVVLSTLVGGIALTGSAVAAENLHDGSTTHPSTGEYIYAANASEEKSITYGYVVENVTNTGESIELYLQFEDPFNNTAGPQRLSSFGGNVTCICGGTPESVGVESSATIVDGPDGDGNKETIKIGVQPNKKDKPIDIIVNFTGDVTWTDEHTNVAYNVSGAVDEPNEDVLPAERFEDVIVAGGLYTETNGSYAVTDSGATLSGHVWNLNGTTSANISFTYWKKNRKASTQQSTSNTIVNSTEVPGTFEKTVTGLDAGETYVFESQANNGFEKDDGPTFEFSTSGLNVDTNDATDVEDTSAILRGDLKDLGGASSADVRFRYWEKGNKGNTYTKTSFQTLSSPDTFSETVSGLQSSTTYVFVAEVNTSNGDVAFGEELEVTTANELAVDTKPASDISDTGATLNGDVTGLAGSDSVDVRFRYWEKGNKINTYAKTDFRSMSSTGGFSEAASGLNPNTTYLVVAEVEDSDGDVDFGQEFEFTTADDLNVDTTQPTDVKDTSATLNGDLTGLGGADSVAVRFRYWKKGNKLNTYTKTDFRSMSSTGTFSEALSGLNTNTTYVVLAEVENPGGNVDFGQKLQFTTADDLNVTTESASNVGSSSATLNGKLTSMQGENSVDVRFRYWEKGNKANTYNKTGFRSMSSTGSFSESVSNLGSGTTYVFVAEVETQDGEVDIGREREFSTS